MVRILTDSAADLPEELARQLNVEVLPLGVTFEDGMAYRDRVDLQPEEFYEKLAACEKLPKTSQPNLGDVLTAFESARDAGDEMVAIFISSQLSGTYQSACMAADTVEYPGIHVVDSLNAAMGQHLLVRLAVHLRDVGKSAVQIAATLEHAKEHLHLVAAIDDLKYLRKGGRLPAAVAVAGGMLGIKPLITLKEGKVAMAGKARGLPGAYVALFKKIEELGGINPRFDSLAGYTVSTREVAPIQTYLVDNLGLPEPLVRQIGCVIGTHAGPGAFGLAFFDNGLVID